MCVVGNIQVRNYEDRDGNKRTSVDIEFLSPKDEDEPETPQKPKAKKKTLDELKPVENEDLPF